MGLGHSPSIVLNGLVLALDAGNVKSYPGSGTTWTDLSGRGNNGTLTNGPIYSSANGGSIVFDGTNDYVAPTGLTDAFWQGNWTASFWVNFDTNSNTDDGTSDKTLLQHGISFTRSGLHLTQRNTSIFLGLFSDDLYGNAILTTGTWYNFVFTLNNTTRVKQIYMNGNLDASDTGVGAYVGTGNNSIIGGPSLTFGSHFDGFMPSCSFYNRVLSAAEVTQNFNALKGRFVLGDISVTGITATGGTISNYTSGGISYRAHIFTSSGTFQVTSGIGTVEYLIVAGGGSGSHGTSGFTYGGAGGGGQVLTGSTEVVSQAYSITVGAGGVGVNGNGNDGNDGSDSVFSTFTARGGKKGLANGNGGNSGNNLFSGASRSGITGGGGGGAGGNASSTTTGGVGVSNSIVGSLVTYGGGGGGSNDSVNGLGSDGGGDGGAANNPVGSGTTNRGGGGGSTRAENPNNSGSGGSGIVIIRYSI